MTEMNTSELHNVQEQYYAAKKRLLLFDYDGTLVPTVAHPEDAAPSDELRSIMKKLSEDSRNTFVIVSGRKHKELEQWLGWLPVEFVAEHSVMRREKGGEWRVMVAPDEVQIAVAKSLLMEFAEPYEGTVLEEKAGGIALHYRHASELNDGMIERWVKRESRQFSDNDLVPIHGKKIIELVPKGVDKGVAARYWLDRGNWDFILAAGDDTTDEAMFRVLKSDAIAVHVGNNPNTAARYTIPEQADFITLLKQLAN